ncbi:hypothetical protein Avbf_05988 [Armadillidium vulgare]|nr:hypothetical protein Avbf_05988 [Armadillidium vulgare]
MQVVYAPYPGANLRKLTRNLVNHLNESFTHMVVFTLITEAYNKVDLGEGGEGRWKRKYEVVEPNEDFDTTDFASRFRGFEDACRLRCPNLKIWLMIPPYLDLIYYNQRKLFNYPLAIKSRYYEEERFQNHVMHAKMVDIYHKLKAFSYQGPSANSYPVMFVINNSKRFRKHTEPFLNGRKMILGIQGFLWDGIHPSRELIVKIWRKMRDAGYFDRTVIIPDDSSTRVETAPFMTLEVEPSLVPANVESNSNVLVPDNVENVLVPDNVENVLVPDNVEISVSSDDENTPAERTVTIIEGQEQSQSRNEDSARVEEPTPSTSGIRQIPSNLRTIFGPAPKRRKLAQEFEIEKEIEKQVHQLIVYLMGYFVGQRNPITEEELKRKMKGKKVFFYVKISHDRLKLEIVGEPNKDLLKKLFEKLLEEEIIQRLNSLRRQ